MATLARGHRQEAPVDPGRPHEFVEVSDPGMAAVSIGAAGGRLGGISPVTVVDNYVRKSRCGLAGCGRDRFDPLHVADRGQGDT